MVNQPVAPIGRMVSEEGTTFLVGTFQPYRSPIQKSMEKGC